MQSLLLHVCCGPCSTVAVPWWRSEGFEPVGLFANPNIQPAPEYQRRLGAMRTLAESTDLELLVDDHETPSGWAAAVGLPTSAAQPDRCHACLSLRLREAAWAAAARGLSHVATSLTVSPWQRHDLIAQAGLAAAEEAGVEFLYADLSPYYRRSIDESRRLALYRQPYCGCAASKWETWHDRRARRAARGGRAA
jgi:epoxyqueuosine reductase